MGGRNTKGNLKKQTNDSERSLGRQLGVVVDFLNTHRIKGPGGD